MGSQTPVYALRYPVGTDAPQGAVPQMQNLATDVDTALTTIHLNPNAAWVAFAVAAMSAPAGTSGYATFSITAQSVHNLFALADPTTITTSRTGTYVLAGQVRATAAGAPATGTYLQALWEHPAGTPLWDHLRAIFNTGAIDMTTATIVKLAAGTGLSLRFNNSSAQAENLTAPATYQLLWIAP